MSHQHHMFHNPRPATPDDVHVALDRGEIHRTLDAMVGCALYGEGDWKQPQELYLLLLDHDNTQVRALAATCLGHLARVHGQLDEQRVAAALRLARSTGKIGATADNALEDIEHYLHNKPAR